MPHILVVEDDPTNAKLLELILKRIGGFEVTVTEDAAYVVDKVASGDIDLVMMDVSLSNTRYNGNPTDGLELTRVLKSENSTRTVPIVLSTAHALKGDKERLVTDCGADGYVSKPIEDNHALVKLLKDIILQAPYRAA